MKKTVYIYREASAEFRLADYKHDIAALKRSHLSITEKITTTDYNIEKEFTDRAEAEKWLHKHYPVYTFSGSMGMVFRYILVTGAYIEEVSREIDSEGEIVDEDYVGIVAQSDFPPITVMNSWGREVDYAAAANLMDDEIREKLARSGIDDPQEFFDAYADAHEEKFDEEWVPNTTSMTW